MRVPVANRVGAENQGWTVAKHLLEYERGSGGVSAGLKIPRNELKRIAAFSEGGAPSLLQDTAFTARLRALEIQFVALEFMEISNLARMLSGQHPGSGASSSFKIMSIDVQQTINTLRLEAVLYFGLPDHTVISLNGVGGERVGPAHAETVAADCLTSRAAFMYGGSHQVQRNITAKSVSGL